MLTWALNWLVTFLDDFNQLLLVVYLARNSNSSSRRPTTTVAICQMFSLLFSDSFETISEFCKHLTSLGIIG